MKTEQPRYSGNPGIRRSQIEKERVFLNLVKQRNRDGEAYRPVVLDLAGHHALDRLEQKGLIRFAKSRKGWTRGWVARGFRLLRGQVVRRA